MTVDELLDGFIEGRRGKVLDSTITLYRLFADKELSPMLGSMSVDDVSDRDLGKVGRMAQSLYRRALREREMANG